MADEFRGAPDLLAPYYLVEVQSPMRGPRAVEGHAPRQLLRVPAWRTALTSMAPSERN
jgi:hypothetical protein